jgi:hypothetical protein
VLARIIFYHRLDTNRIRNSVVLRAALGNSMCKNFIAKPNKNTFDLSACLPAWSSQSSMTRPALRQSVKNFGRQLKEQPIDQATNRNNSSAQQIDQATDRPRNRSKEQPIDN